MQYIDLAVAGRLVQEMRLASGITQCQLSQQSGISRATISALENGRLTDIGVKTLGKIFGALKYSIKSSNISEHILSLGVLLKDYREHVSKESVASFATRSGLIPERVSSMESGDGSVTINEWLMAFNCMQVLPDVMDAAKPQMALLASMFDLAKTNGGQQ